MLLGRYDESDTSKGKSLPPEWTEEFVKVLTETYLDKSEKDNRFFDVYGQIFDKEFVVVISYIHHSDQLAAPISIFLSHDTSEEMKSKDLSKALKELIDLSGHILDDIFSQEDWSEFCPNWTENKFRDHTFFYKITRENVSLSLQAEEILKGEDF
ncbi:MAG: hypothetical protein CME67_04065 [Halobacteriovoraceae bacterium]|nr:hypothetical protein [Peredibacter sp.]MBJ00385.1 hypothetical protein [Halobacteriovoraceae bacterium]|tara:strand:+ start:1929 stop:2393 length:465 start_codon:yes stop_codon:yes gene_type:complete